MMEDETGFLSREDEKDEFKLERITKLLSNILSDLNEKKVTTIIGMTTHRHLNILKKFKMIFDISKCLQRAKQQFI